MKYSIVIPTYNHCDDLLKPCVESIIKYSFLEDVELIIVANGCKDETKAYFEYLHEYFNVRQLSGHLKTIFDPEPLGYPKATNMGIRLATTDKIVLLNNDTILMNQNNNDWLNILNTPFENNPKCGISCVVKSFSEPANHSFAIFFCVMIHRKVFDTIGLLNESYGKGAGEDTEFSIEAEKAGFEVVECMEKWTAKAGMWTGGFPIYHAGEKTVHDKSLVSDWEDSFNINSKLLSEKYNPEWYQNKISKQIDNNFAPQALSWMAEKHPQIYKEVIKDNSYQIDVNKMKNRNVIDIGANVGAFSILAAHLGAKKIISVEPAKKSYDDFVENIKKSELKSIVALKNIVSDKNGIKAKISLCEEGTSNSQYNIEKDFEEVDTITLSEILSQLEGDRIFLKMDCEGSEYDILLNATPKEMDRINEIVMEVHTDLHPFYKGSEILENKLTSFGFTMTKSDQIYQWHYNERGEAAISHMLPFKGQKWVRV